ncbi:hypothetical protein BKA82DRAFT_159358, partial [Pisolithus tinctorius]
VACKENWVITSPNMDFVKEPYIFEEEELCCCADGCLGVVDCFQWPQTHEKQYEYSICIPQKHSIPTLQIVWYDPTPSDFVVPTGSQFAVGTLQNALCTLMHLAQHEVMRLRQHPLLFRDLVMFVVQLQHKTLDIYALLEYIEYVYLLLLNPLSRPLQANSTWMGCFVRATKVCEALYFAGVPVWLVCSKEYIPPTMNIVCLV